MGNPYIRKPYSLYSDMTTPRKATGEGYLNHLTNPAPKATVPNPMAAKSAVPGGAYADWLTMQRNDRAQAFNNIIANNDKIANSPIDNTATSPDNSIPGAVEPTPTPEQTGSDTAPEQTGSDAGSVPPTVMTYEDYLTRYAKTPNTIEARSYEDWLVAGGMAGAAQREYDESVRRYETEYERAKAQYGAKAETLGRAGLAGSGYGDYLTGAGFAAMQGAKVAAADTKALTEAQQRSDYANYLMGVEMANEQAKAQADAENEAGYAAYLANSGNVKALIDKQIEAGQDDASIKAYIQQHYGNQFDEYLDGWITNAHTYTDPAMEAAKVEQEKTETEATNAAQADRDLAAAKDLATMYQQGLFIDAARVQMAALGYTEEEINRAISTQQNTSFAQLTSELNVNGIGLGNILTAKDIDNMVVTGQISAEQAQQYKQMAQPYRKDLLAKQFKSFADMSEEEAAAGLADWRAYIDSLSSEDLTDAARGELYGMLADASISGAVESKEPVTSILSDIATLDKDKIGEAAYNGFVDEVSDAMNVEGTKLDGYFGGQATIVKLKVNLGKKANGKDAIETIELIFTSTANDQKARETLGSGNDGEIKVYNGVMYVYQTIKGGLKDRGSWMPIMVGEKSVGSAKNAEILNDILVKYYS